MITESHFIWQSSILLYFLQSTSLKIPGVREKQYKLTGVIVHYKITAKLGHYVAFVYKQGSNKWFYMNDSEVCIQIIKIRLIKSSFDNQVNLVSVATVLQQHPFMLFYTSENGMFVCRDYLVSQKKLVVVYLSQLMSLNLISKNVVRSCNCVYYYVLAEHSATLSLNACKRIRGPSYLNDEVQLCMMKFVTW